MPDSFRTVCQRRRPRQSRDRKSTRLNSSHVAISYAVFCLKKNTKTQASGRQSGRTIDASERSTVCSFLSQPPPAHTILRTHELPTFSYCVSYFFFNDTATTEIYPLSLHDALPIYRRHEAERRDLPHAVDMQRQRDCRHRRFDQHADIAPDHGNIAIKPEMPADDRMDPQCKQKKLDNDRIEKRLPNMPAPNPPHRLGREKVDGPE